MLPGRNRAGPANEAERPPIRLPVRSHCRAGSRYNTGGALPIRDAKDRMSRPLLILGTAVGVILAPACADLTAPVDKPPVDDYELPPPDTSLDPDRLTVGEYIATPCAFTTWGNGLDHLLDRHEWATVDVFFGRGTAEGPWDGPTEEDVAHVRSHGGRVLFRFHVPAVRARIMLSSIPDLVRDGFWITVRDVPDATRYDLELNIGFDRPLRDSDEELIADLGGRIRYWWDFIDGMAIVLPDRSVPVLRGRDDVAYVQVNGVACLD